MLGKKRTGKKVKHRHNKENEVGSGDLQRSREKRAKEELQRLSELQDEMYSHFRMPLAAKEQWEEVGAWELPKGATAILKTKQQHWSREKHPNSVRQISSAQKQLNRLTMNTPIRVKSSARRETAKMEPDIVQTNPVVSDWEPTEPVETQPTTLTLLPVWHRSVCSEMYSTVDKSKGRGGSRPTKATAEPIFLKETDSIRQRILESLNLEKKIVCLQPAQKDMSSTHFQILHSRPRSSKLNTATALYKSAPKARIGSSTTTNKRVVYPTKLVGCQTHRATSIDHQVNQGQEVAYRMSNTIRF